MAANQDIKTLIRAGQRAQALRLLAARLQQAPQDPEAWWLLSHVAETPAQQIEALQRVLQLLPGHPAALRRLAELSPQDPSPTTPSLQKQQPESRAVLSTALGRRWTAVLLGLFALTLAAAWLLSSVLQARAAAAEQEQHARALAEQQLIAELAAAPSELPPVTVVLPSQTAAEPPTRAAESPTAANDALPITGPTAAPTEAPIEPEPTPEPTSALLALDEFISSVANGKSSQRVGVFVESRFSYPIVQQPSSDPAWVTSNHGEVTDFRIVRQQTGNEGLLAHNYLAGGQFYSLRIGDIAELVLGDGTVVEFEIIAIEDYQALSPNSPTSNFINLATGQKLTAGDLFYRVYGGHMTLTFQTCIDRDNISTWGRTFIIGEEL